MTLIPVTVSLSATYLRLWDTTDSVWSHWRDMQAPNQQNGALSHVRICDFTGQLAGAGATRALAPYGAQVIRVEDPVAEGKWDVLRGNAPYVDSRRGPELGGAYNNHNIEKLGITLNTRTERGKALLREIIKISDVVTENFSAGVLERWGFSYEEMKKINPTIIYVSNCGFGHEGPYADFKTFGPIVQAVAGLTFNSGLPGMPAAGWGYSFMDHTGGYYMAIAILLALFYRNRTGEGQWVDMSCTDAGATLNGPAVLDYTVNGRPLRRSGSPHTNHSAHPLMSPHNVYKCEGDDNWVAIAARNDDDWHKIADVMEHSEWKRDPRFKTVADRRENEDALDQLIQAWTSSRQHKEVMHLLQAELVPAALVSRPEDRIEHDENTRAWGLWPEVTHKEIGKVRVDGVPIKLSQTPERIAYGAPTLGQHNDFVFGELLKLGAAEIEQLRKEQVI